MHKHISQLALLSLTDQHFGKHFASTVKDFAVTVVRVRTNDFLHHVDTLWSTLSLSETARAKGYVKEDTQLQFIIHRGLLRFLLAHLVSAHPSSIAIDTDQNGKLFLRGHGCYFNLSHSANCALYSFSMRSPVGIDVEEDDGSLCIEPLVPLCFSPDELRAFHSLSTTKKRHAFFRVWTQKEAISKCHGLGLRLDFTTIHVGWQSSATSTTHSSLACTSILDISSSTSCHAALAYLPMAAKDS